MKNEYKIIGDHVEVKVKSKHGEFTVLIDTEDICKLENKSVCLFRRGPRNSPKNYFGVTHGGKLVSLHKYLTGYEGEMVIDHFNGKTEDNRKSNLRIGTLAQNQQNRSYNKNNRLGIKGVAKIKGKYQATLRKNREKVFCERFNTLEEAVEARRQAELKYHEWSPLKQN